MQFSICDNNADLQTNQPNSKRRVILMDSFKEVTFSVQMKTIYMFDFLYWHSYHGVTGIINYALSFAGIAALIAGFGKGNAFITDACV
jgi:hypothetical protein